MAELKRYRVKVSNKGPGPRTIFTSEGGHTVPTGGSLNLLLNEDDVKGIQPYLDLGHLTLEDAGDEDDAPLSQDIGGVQPSGNPVDAPTQEQGDIIPASADDDDDDDDDQDDDRDGATDGEGGDDSNGDKPTHIEHRGFGRWFGMKGENPITEAMNKAEIDAYAEEHGIVQRGKEPDPSDETPPEETPESTDNADEDQQTGE